MASAFRRKNSRGQAVEGPRTRRNDREGSVRRQRAHRIGHRPRRERR